jgi:hypothetical protein
MPSMFHSPSDATQRKRADSRSTDDDHQYHYIRERSRKSLPSSPASPLSLHRSGSRRADILDKAPGRIFASLSFLRNPSPQSSPVTSPSSAHGGSSRFADSQSSFTSESASAEPWSSRSRCEDGHRVPAIMRPPHFGTPPSPVSGRSRSITESDLRLLMHDSTRKPASKRPASSPRTTPHSHITTDNPDSHVSMGIKFLLSKPAPPVPTHLSLHSPPASETLSHSRHAMPRKSRPQPPELDVSASPFSPGYSHPDQTGVPLVNQDSLQSPSPSSMPTQGREPRQRNVLRRKPSAKAREKMQRELEKKDATASPSSSARGSISVSLSRESPFTHSGDWPLTPAGTVVRAYKQREDPSPVPPANGGATSEPSSPSPIPYYTIYGSRSEHKIAAGGPDDTRQWSLHAHAIAGHRAQTRQEGPGTDLSRKGSLSRKVSGRWKKATGGGGKADESRPPLHGHSSGRSSLQERRCPSLGRDHREPLAPGEFGTDLHQTRSVTEPRNNLKEGSCEGSKIWKLVKRISTGGMRERFVADKAAPPVPAIPKELLNSPPPQSQALRAGVQKSYSPSMPKTIVNSGPRPSTTTTSSSPNSSDVASACFFQRSHSRRSSVSSYGEETAMHSSFLNMADHHIILPQELRQIVRDQTKDQDSMTRSRGRSYSGRSAPSTEGKTDSDDRHHRVVNDPWEMSLHNAPTSVTSLRTHRVGEKPPMITHTQLLPDGNVSLSPPPRPARSTMRSNRFSQSEISFPRPRPATADEEPVLRTSPGASSTLSEVSTVTMQLSSNSSTPTSKEVLDISHLRSGINFRELNAAARCAPLTEQEKAEIWNDLLARSAQAGGTLHLGGSGQLESDNLRYSNCSEVSRS